MRDAILGGASLGFVLLRRPRPTPIGGTRSKRCFLRLGAALARVHADAPPPIYRFMSADGFAFGFPPYGLRPYLPLLDEVIGGVPWTIAGG